MNRHSILTALMLGTASVGAVAQINSPDATGYLERARAMFADRNYTGCADQLRQFTRLYPAAAQAEEAARLSALSALHLGQKDALELIDEWLAAYPSSPFRQSMLAAKGDYYFTRGEYAEALDRYAAVDETALTGLEADDLIYRRSYSYLMLAEFDKAREGFKQLRGATGYATAANFYLGYMAYAEGEYHLAMTYLPEAAGNPELGPAAEYYMAQILFAEGDYERALNKALAALKSDAVPQFAPEANRVAGESLFNLGREDEAVGYLRRYAAATDSPKPSAFYILGVSEYKLGNYQEAIDKLSRVANCDDAMGQSACLFLGQSYVQTGNTDGALLAFEKAYRMGYDREVAESALYNYAVAKSRGGRVPFGNSVAMFENFLRQYPDSRYAPEVQEYIVSGYMTDNDYESALKAIDAMKRPTPAAMAAKQRALFSLGTRDYAAGRYTQALQRFESAARISGADSDLVRLSLLWQGNCQYELDRYDRAARSFAEYIRQSPASDPNMAIARYDLAYAEFAAANYAAALTDFRRLIDMKPADKAMLSDAYNRAGDCLYYKSDFSGAMALYDKAYSIDPDAGDYALYQQAVMKGLMRDHKGKIAGIDDLIARYPSSGLIPAAMLEKAESYAALGDNKGAIAVYNDLITTYPTTAYGRKGLLQLAITYQSGGRTADALEAYKSVVAKYPTSEEARLAADDLKRIYADRGQLGEFTAFMASVPDAPQTDPSELDALAFRAAEADYINNDRTERLEAYLRDYPHGTHEAQALYLMAEAANAAGRTDEALELSSRLISSHPDADAVEDALLIKAEAEQSQGRGEAALATFRQLESRAAGARTLQNARMGVMRTAIALGENDEALAAADKLLASSAAGQTETAEIRFTRALALSRLGRTPEAVSVWTDLASDPTELYGSRSAVALAEAYLGEGNYAAAQSAADALINANPPHQYWLARGFIALSDALRAQGNEFEADEYLRSLRANYPGTETEIFEMIDSRLDKQN